jgi:hypothetical protein
MNIQNTVKCIECGRTYISEEYESHSCHEIVMFIFDTDGNRWGSHDRIKFFRLPSFKKLTSDDNLQEDDTSKDPTKSGQDLIVIC